MRKIVLWSLLGLVIGAASGALLMNYYNNLQHPISPKKIDGFDKIEFNHINPLLTAKDFKDVYFDEMLGCNENVLEHIDEFLIEHPDYELSFYFKDLTTGAVIEYNEDLKFTPSSLMKVPVLVALFKVEDENPGTLYKEVVFQQKIKNAVTDDQYPFKYGQSYTLLELAEIMIKYSDNNATLMIINEIGMNQVKNVERDLRLGTEKVSDGKNRVIGIKSYCRVFRVLYNTSYLSKNSSETCLKILTKPRYNLGIRSAIPEEIEVSHKFGRRDLDVTDRNEKMHIEQLHHVGIVYRKHKPYLIGIMIKGDDEVAMEKAIYDLTKHVDEVVEHHIEIIEEENISADLR